MIQFSISFIGIFLEKPLTDEQLNIFSRIGIVTALQTYLRTLFFRDSGPIFQRPGFEANSFF